MPPATGVKVKLDRQRVLRYTFGALVALENETGESFSATADKLQAGSMAAINLLLWAGLRHEDRSLTPEDVADMVEVDQLTAISEAIAEAVAKAFPEDEGNAKAASAKKKG